LNNYLQLPDIKSRIATDFGDKSIQAVNLLRDTIRLNEYLNHPRILRCILFLSNGNIDNLNKNIEIAKLDPRDIMLFAEYLHRGNNEQPERLRDFNNPFPGNLK